MTTRRLYRPPPNCATPSQVPPVAEGVAISVAGFDGRVIATISRRLESSRDTSDESVVSVVSVVSVEGDVDLDTAPLLEQALLMAINDRPRTCLELDHVDFFSAAGVSVLLKAHRHAAGLGHSFALHGVHGITERVLSIMGLDRAFPSIN
jgi:anti-sigma B factor antagonist